MTRPAAELHQMAQAHLWGHFTPIGPQADEVTVIERGEGCYVWDSAGRRYLDGLAGLFTVQVGHGRHELAAAAAAPGRDAGLLPDLDLRPPARDRAGRPASPPWRPVTSTGCSSPPAAPRRSSRPGSSPASTSGPSASRAATRSSPATSPTTAPPWAPSPSPGCPATANAVRAARARRLPRGQHQPLPLRPAAPTRRPARSRCADDIERRDPRRRAPRPSPRCSSSRCRTPAAASRPPEGYFARVREICDRYGVLLVSDEVICAFGRLGTWFGCRALRLPARHDHHGQGPHVGLLAARRRCWSATASPSRSSSPARTFLHGITFGGHPVSCAVALANLDLFERDGLLGHVREQRGRVPRRARHPRGPALGRRDPRAWATSTASSW